ncbi:hypothetical protein, partial [Pseudomonas lactis]|uniref:hypothetical protein n=1 Tax=Pseudomonas lactis TaxID=1615674 RepID=UPI001F3A47D9
ARRAERTAKSTSTSPQAATRARSWLVAGLMASKVAPDSAATALVASHAELDELVDKTRIAVDRTARIAGKL